MLQAVPASNKWDVREGGSRRDPISFSVAHAINEVRRGRISVDLLQFLVQLVLQRHVLNLLHRVEVYSVIVGAEFLALKELDGCLVELEHDYFVEEAEALNVSIRALYRLSQARNLLNLALLAAEESAQRVFSILQFS